MTSQTPDNTLVPPRWRLPALTAWLLLTAALNQVVGRTMQPARLSLWQGHAR